jgi:uncharacterized membrane protein (Fun14 family)
MNGIESFAPTTATMSGGFFTGILIGYALKKVIKLVVVIFGLFLAGSAYLQYHRFQVLPVAMPCSSNSLPISND